MSRALLDVNVLLALHDAEHLDHERAWAWAEGGLVGGWASCAITENGFIRTIGQPSCPNPVSPGRAATVLRDTRRDTDHGFWPCDVSAIDPSIVAFDRVHGSQQLTDVYLIALAVRRDARFVTFDRRVSLDAVPGAADGHLEVL